MEKNERVITLDDNREKWLRDAVRDADKMAKKMAKADQKKTVKRSPAKKK